jgi:hypothetical protein
MYSIFLKMWLAFLAKIFGPSSEDGGFQPFTAEYH